MWHLKNSIVARPSKKLRKSAGIEAAPKSQLEDKSSAVLHVDELSAQNKEGIKLLASEVSKFKVA